MLVPKHPRSLARNTDLQSRTLLQSSRPWSPKESTLFGGQTEKARVLEMQYERGGGVGEGEGPSTPKIT